LPESKVDVTLYAQMCYPGQNFDMSVPVPEGTALDEPGLLDLMERFHDEHEADRGFCFRNQQPLLRGVRLVARGETPKPPHLAETGTVRDADGARVGTRAAYFGVEYVDTPVYAGPQLAPGASVTGPALIEEPFTVVVVPPAWSARLDDLGNYELGPG
jgi:N-methylhydantoinase A